MDYWTLEIFARAFLIEIFSLELVHFRPTLYSVLVGGAVAQLIENPFLK